ncbi:calcium:proton antiporter [Enteractinococcus helveticum]|uniref:Calcium:proton antiporter n=1 Tax=Enteractinococcus helveticum TaxID=1837282 RepID=A0A1B7LXJ2_9MICC|nr:calcium:proton antiporter [Enteractinococcus helveticum]OAV59884.1 calcium:proton antiporter [Enteractinococcus helveticum]
MTSALLRSILTPSAILQFIIGWAAVVFFRLGSTFFQPPQKTVALVIILVAIVAVIICAAFGVVTQAEHLARRLGDPYGTLILTMSIVMIEVILIAAVMLGPGEHPTIARDSVMAVSMIILNLVVGLALIVGGLRHAKLRVNRTGVGAYLGILLPLLTVGLVLPAFIGDDGQYSVGQAIPIVAMTILVYGLFLYFQTGRQRTDFQEPTVSANLDPAERGTVTTEQRSSIGQILRVHRSEILARTLLLVATVLPIVLLSHDMATYLDTLLDRAGAPVALSGIVIATIVFLPETVTTVRAAAAGEMQRVSNLCHGALVSTVGLTIPVVLIIGMVTGQSVILGESPAHMILLAVSLLLTFASFLGGRATAVHGMAHLMIFSVYILTLMS